MCRLIQTMRDGSFFSKSKLSLQKWVILMYWWATQYPVTNAAEEAEVTEATACQIYQWLREVCSTKLINTPIVLGGPNVTDQIFAMSKVKSKYSLLYSLPYMYHSMYFPGEHYYSTTFCFVQPCPYST